MGLTGIRLERGILAEGSQTGQRKGQRQAENACRSFLPFKKRDLLERASEPFCERCSQAGATVDDRSQGRTAR